MAGPEDRVSREEMYPKAGEITEPLQALIPPFGEKIMEGLRDGLKEGSLSSASLRLIHQGENPQTLEVEMRGPNLTGNRLEIELKGNWQPIPEVPKGRPITADYNGWFWRQVKPEDSEPIADNDKILEADDPYALATQGKGKRWYLKLSSIDFPRGGRISEFVQPNGTEVIKGETILLYVEPL